MKQHAIAKMGQLFVKQMPFNVFLKLEVEHLDAERAVIRFPFQEVLIGNPMQKILHGGVISAVLDNVGGMLAAASIIDKTPDEQLLGLNERLAKLGTIDLRTDFLRPGWGEQFTASATLIRSGNKVCVCRMEMHNEQGVQIAFGTATYLVS